MTISATAAYLASLGFFSATIWAGAMDLVTMKIRNEIVLFLLGTYAALAPLAGLDPIAIGWSAAAASAVLLCMFIFFGLGWIGGGDAKLASVVALWLGPEHVPTYLLYTALFGGALTLIILQFRLFALPGFCLDVFWIRRLHAKESGIPYGLAIASAAVFVFPDTSWMIIDI
ncbi:prepilin peptidase [Microvirga sp. GCM10011540]|uniref:A24 family peptidase n=1 Tax=Microvirga sp. GCM10011540 TaxID=3317338 RepID=UPI00361EF5F1